MTASASPPSSFAEARILVIDDEPANTTVLARLLASLGYRRVTTTNDPREALALYARLQPDLVLLDLLMPDIDGYAILGQIADPTHREIRPPVLVLTADVTLAARQRALELGAADFVTKPFDHLEVALRIRNLLASYFLQLDLQREKANLERAVAERTAELRRRMEELQRVLGERQVLMRLLVGSQEAERRRIAGEIHDETVQMLAALAIRLELVARDLPDPAAKGELETLRAMVSEGIASLRRLLFELVPTTLQHDGLGEALRQLAAQLAEAGGTPVEVQDRLDRPLPDEVATVLFRIAHEAITNARRHAAASRILVDLEPAEEGVCLRVRDDGRGFDPDSLTPARPGHLGLVTMRERALLAGGRLVVESGPGRGTTVTAWIPLTSPAIPEPDSIPDPRSIASREAPEATA
jgi:signal transduction histidine kinase